ncbi:MAG: hypothetical protein J6X58_06615 [Bacteroidales bacterium]|nr:hypothetical protein [Bacteroidales bacterium]
MKKTDKVNTHTFFQPTFGNRPDQYIGRDGEIEGPLQLVVENREICYRLISKQLSHGRRII